MRILLIFILLLPSFAIAEQFTCSYPNYVDGAPVILKVKINGTTAIIDGKFPQEYNVLENNEYGLVLVYAFSGEGTDSPKQNDVGLFGFVIDKVKMKMVRGNITQGDMSNSLSSGTCKR